MKRCCSSATSLLLNEDQQQALATLRSSDTFTAYLA